jgi:nifR3 family TIM-barrel protein
MAKRIEDKPFAILDINMGCPVPKVVNNGEGSALMKNPKLVGEIVEKTVKAVNKPVTVKIRKGFNEASVNAVEIAKIAQESGAAAVAVHGRTREQYYAGEADWEIIAQVKQALTIPVIGNGDVTDGPSAAKLIKETGCDGIMIGRAVRGNPWIFREVAHFLKTGKELERPTAKELQETILRHAGMELEYKGEYTAVREMRKHIGWYTTGYPGSAALRREINAMESYEELAQAVKCIFEG